jgi:hypothetical protein
MLDGNCTFNVLVYADADSDVPLEWGDSDAKEIKNGEKVQLRSFSSSNHRVDTLVSYRYVESNTTVHVLRLIEYAGSASSLNLQTLHAIAISTQTGFSPVFPLLHFHHLLHALCTCVAHLPKKHPTIGIECSVCVFYSPQRRYYANHTMRDRLDLDLQSCMQNCCTGPFFTDVHPSARRKCSLDSTTID